MFGAGAVGGHFAARLARGGSEVSVVARGEHLAAIRAHGLRVNAPDASFTVRVAASADPAELGPQDIVLVTVKAPALGSVATAIAPLLGPDTAVAFALNGIPWWYFDGGGGPHEGTRLERIDPGDAIRNAVGVERTIGGVIYSACTVTEPGIIAVASAHNSLILGEPNGQHTARVERLAQALQAGGIAGRATTRIREAVWSKLAVNLSIGPLAVLSQSFGAVLFEDPACCDALHQVAAEVAAIAGAMGYPIQTGADEQIRNSRSLGHRPSILQDLQLGRSMEVDAMFTVPRDIARMAGVATPTLDLLVALSRLRAAAAGLYTL